MLTIGGVRLFTELPPGCEIPTVVAGQSCACGALRGIRDSVTLRILGRGSASRVCCRRKYCRVGCRNVADASRNGGPVGTGHCNRKGGRRTGSNRRRIHAFIEGDQNFLVKGNIGGGAIQRDSWK